MFLWNIRQLCWILFLRLVRLKTKLIFFLKVLRKKLIKIETTRIFKIRSLSHIHKRQQNYRSPQNLMCLPTVFNFLYYWKLIKIVSELVSTGSLKFGVSLKHFLVFAKPDFNFKEQNKTHLFCFLQDGVKITEELANKITASKHLHWDGHDVLVKFPFTLNES